MHHVLFNNIIKYNPEEGTLHRIDNPDNKLKLYESANKCLQVLIDAYPAPVIQRFFLEDVWEKNGQSATANTFYQCISAIRKAFSNLGITEDVIITTPRKGVSLSAALTINILHANVIMEQPSISVPKINKFNKKTLITFVLIMGMVIAIYALFLKFQMQSQPEKINKLSDIYSRIGSYQQCVIYNDKHEPNDVKKVIEVINEQKINCNEDISIFHASTVLPLKESTIVCYVKRHWECFSYYRAN